MTDEKIERTFRRLQQHPDNGCVLVFEWQQQLIGYALLINFWSNEYGGNVLNIAELYVLEAFRAQGIGSHFIRYLQETNFNDCVALELEVLTYNTSAFQLYWKLGFQASDRRHLLLRV